MMEQNRSSQTQTYTLQLAREMESEVDEESQDSQIVDIIPIRFDVNYEAAADSSQSNSSTNKGKYYKQTYRSAWEQMPDFKGWLRGVPGEPTRAYCIFCQKTLHAHRLSLLKHTCTIRHQKAAQLHSIRKNKGQVQYMEAQPEIAAVLGATSSAHEDGDGEEVENMIEYADADQSVSVMLEDGDNEHEIEDEEDEEEGETITLEKLPVEIQKQFRQKINPMASQKPPISTHVLDTSKGSPVVGLQVSLYKLIDGRWTYINEGITNPDGRFANFLERTDFSTGRYKLHYDVDRYFEVRKQDSLYPFIEIVIDCRAPTDHYHVPLLLSPFGYTTYRGS